MSSGLPPSIEAAWGRRARPATGPKPGLSLIVDAALGASPPRLQGEDWRAGPDPLGVALSRRPAPASLGPGHSDQWTAEDSHQIAWLEDGLTSLAETGLEEQQKLSTALLLSGYVRGEATLTAQLAADTSIMPRRSGQLRYFPALHRALTSGVLDHDDEVTLGLDRLLDGIEALIPGR